MDHKQVINQRQMGWLTAAVITSGGLFNWQSVLIRISEMDAWFSYLLSVFYVFVIAAFFGYLAKMFPGQNMFEISMLLLGRPAGIAVNLLILFHFWHIVMGDIGSMSRFSSTLLLHYTPVEILILAPCLLLIYFGKSSVEIVARLNDIFYPLFVAATMLMPLLLSNEFYLRLITPVLTMPYHNLIASNVLTLGSAGDIFMIGAFLHTIYNSNHIRSAIRHGSLLGISLFTLYIFIVLIVLGPKMPANFIYPAYNLVQMIHITDFLDRVDIILLTIWMPTLAVKTYLTYLAILIGISSMIRERNYPVINKPVGLLLALTTFLSFKSTTDLLTFVNFSSPFIMLAYQPLFMIILIAACKIRNRKQPCSSNQSDGESGNKTSQASPKRTAQMSQLFSYQQWRWFGNGFMLFSAFCVAVGPALSKYKPIIGTACAYIFGFCLILTVLTTYMEVTLLKQSQAGK